MKTSSIIVFVIAAWVAVSAQAMVSGDNPLQPDAVVRVAAVP